MNNVTDNDLWPQDVIHVIGEAISYTVMDDVERRSMMTDHPNWLLVNAIEEALDEI